MKLKPLKIGIHEYFITEDTLEEWGRTEWGTDKIKIHGTLREKDKRMTLLHELLHVALMHTGIKGNEGEKMCTELEYPLFEILVRNKEIIKYIGGYK